MVKPSAGAYHGDIHGEFHGDILIMYWGYNADIDGDLLRDLLWGCIMIMYWDVGVTFFLYNWMVLNNIEKYSPTDQTWQE